MLSISRRKVTPTGVVEAFPIDEMPIKGWVLCDGRRLPKDLYVELYSVISSLYGEDQKTFSVPNYLNRYLKQTTVAEYHNPTLKHHTHTVDIPAGGAHQHTYHVAPFDHSDSRGDSGSYKPTIIRMYRGKTEEGGEHIHKVDVSMSGVEFPVLKSLNIAYFIKI